VLAQDPLTAYGTEYEKAILDYKADGADWDFGIENVDHQINNAEATIYRVTDKASGKSVSI
jgi:hypothetical protein